MSDSQFCVAACHHCGQHIEFPAEGIGAPVTCPHCEQETILDQIVTEVTDSNPESDNEINAGELKEAMTGSVPRRRISLFYQLGLLLVAIFMVLLPVAYLAFVGSIAYGTYWYGVHARVLFSSLSGGVYGLIFRAIIYFGPIVGGTVAVFFMFKPILARPRKRVEPVELNPAQNPRLYQFIAQVSDLLQVPVPRRIYLDCELNARSIP